LGLPPTGCDWKREAVPGDGLCAKRL
jgi:hypothetical protein